ncbi:hypothetical protein L1987_58803 [Smallanthus sonchifolius]|uniref:Uncharacterized protein n=1 Tax=Smallanthus sonchifolius TaxID=185202 RepID=A0ACB9D3P0_9ASTR|nr:hypothetical protein L1987_58803 [Smallanthus sonchifolius]
MGNKKRSFFTVLSILLILLISFNGASIFSIYIPYPENVAGDSRNLVSVSSSLANLMYTVEEENPSVISNTQLKLQENTAAGAGDSSRFVSVPYPENVAGDSRNSVSVTSSLSNLMYSVGEENPSVVSNTQLKLPQNTMAGAGAGDSTRFISVPYSMHDEQQQQPVISNTHLPLLRKSHSLPLESEDFPVKNKKILEVLTFMESSDQLRRGEFRAKVKQFFSKNESSCKLKNSIGAQTLDLDSKNWSRLNNAVMVFDKMHPLVYKFIEEFALTFNGNKWGHNGPYLVSRVVARLQGRPGYNFTILPPMAFYPVNWNRVRNLFRGARNETDAKWLRGKLRQIRSQSYGVHLWNKQSRKLRIEEGSIVGKILSNHCVFCNSSTNNIVRIE